MSEIVIYENRCCTFLNNKNTFSDTIRPFLGQMLLIGKLLNESICSMRVLDHVDKPLSKAFLDLITIFLLLWELSPKPYMNVIMLYDY